MATYKNRVEVPGSEKDALPQSELVGDVPADERFQVTVRVRRQAELPPLDSLAAQLPQERQYLTKAEFNQQHGAAQADLDAVAAFAAAHGLSVE